MPSPQRTVDLVINGSLVRFDRRAVAEKLAVRILDEPVPALAGARVAVNVRPGADAREAPGRGVAFLIDDKLWPISSPDVAALNSSIVGGVTDEEWDAYARGADLAGPPR
ncbi:hypothetical protein [Actinophytocola sp.]|uniref:hypothetical protein n=1 Tax=Actinophytocola sp. TaxID=1872138 RepID=UPI00345BAB5D